MEKMFLSPYTDILCADGNLILLIRRDNGEKICFRNVDVHAVRCFVRKLQDGMTKEEIMVIAENAGLADVLDSLLDQCICKGLIE